MKRICTQIVTFCLFAISHNLFAQSISISQTDPAPTPAFGTDIPVTSSSGFVSTNTTTLTDFPKNKVTTLTSPAFYYTSSQTTIYFKYNFTIAVAGTTTTSPVITINYGSGSFSVTSSEITIVNGSNDLFFSVTPGSLFPANTNFTISVTLDITPNDKTVTANSFSTNAIPVGSATPLPVKLVSFRGSLNKNTVQLQWLVAENETAKSFEVQKSTNGVNFSSVAVLSANTKAGDATYSFSETTTSEKLMYRLKMYDVDSKAEYSKTLVFNTTAASQKSLQVLTNPVKEKLIISFSNEVTENAQINIYDHMGRIMQKQSLSVSQGINTTTVVLNSTYRSGLYIVELVTKTGKLSEKLIYSNQ